MRLDTILHRGVRAMVGFWQRFLLACVLACVVCAAPRTSSADIILDDFTDTVGVIESPAMENDYFETLSVGELGATRRIRIGAAGADPKGTLDVNATSAGIMTARIDSIEQTVDLIAISAVQFNYDFDVTDVTEGGRNDAILFDFAELQGEVQPTFLRALVFEETHNSTYQYELFPLIANDSPHTLAMPFDGFTLRGGSPGLPDLTTLRLAYFDLFFLGQSGDLNWSARLERIRFGRAVPEVGTAALLCISIVPLTCSRFARKGLCRDDSHMEPGRVGLGHLSSRGAGERAIARSHRR